MSKIVAVIPARGGSKRVLLKNLRQINGIPLVGLAVNQAYESELIEEVYLSTDDIVIAETGKNYGAKVPWLRPNELADDKCGDYEVMLHFVKWYESEYGYMPEILIQIRPTAPIRNKVDIEKSIKMFLMNPEVDSLRSVSEPHQSPYKMWEKTDGGYLKNIMQGKGSYDGPTQVAPKTFSQDGVIDIIRVRSMVEKESISGNRILGYSEHEFTWDLDTIEDINFVHMFLKKKNMSFYCDRRSLLDGKLGIIQGRLTEASKLQSFPKNWRMEFEKARECGYCYIEMFRDQFENKENPLWNSEAGLNDIEDVALRSGVSVRNLCDDYVLSCHWDALTVEEYIKIVDLIKIGNQLNVQKIIYPLLSTIDFQNEEILKKTVGYLKGICRIANTFHIKILLEINAKSEEMKKLKLMVNEENFSFCIDTGNLFSVGYDVPEILEEMEGLYSLIHIKDKNIHQMNVVLGEGLVPFDRIMQILKKQRYTGDFTFETNRGIVPCETAVKNIKFIREKLSEV